MRKKIKKKNRKPTNKLMIYKFVSKPEVDEKFAETDQKKQKKQETNQKTENL